MATLGKAAFQELVRFFRHVSQLQPETWRVSDFGPLLLLRGHGLHGETIFAFETEPGASEHEVRAVQ
ncbi:MAG: hypothetical protein M1357_03000 [Candidatus Marsarchaeota archaeon]|nr:hypothetical protein [Candidatus Marsarchaeota archaeon]